MLPMVVVPKLWAIDSQSPGGYLTYNILKQSSLIHSSLDNSGVTLVNSDLIYKHINLQNSVPFKINTLFYNFIIEHGYNLNLLISNIDDIENNPNKDELKSNFLHQNYILNLSKFFMGRTFYFTMFFDWRGRIYTETSYLTFQGNSFAKAMLEFNDGGLIADPEHFDVLLAYGASLYGFGKLSFQDRVNWSITNLDIIVSLDSEFILSAEEPFLFIAWSLEIKKNKLNIINKTPFVSHLPIQWDATCNGLQHLSLLVNDLDLAKSVNICPSSS